MVIRKVRDMTIILTIILKPVRPSLRTCAQYVPFYLKKRISNARMMHIFNRKSLNSYISDMTK